MDITLQNTLATIIQQLADFFGVAADTITENAPMWLAQFGWFALMEGLGVVLLLGALFIIIAVFITVYVSEEIIIVDKHSTTVKACIVAAIVILLVVIGIWLAPCLASPELYGLKALINLIHN